MLHIAVCDDDSIHQTHSLELLRDYLSQRPGLRGEVRIFDSGEALVAYAAEHGGFDLCLLDILMPGLDGVETGRRLRKLGGRGEIIFLSSSNEFAADSYDVGAFFYLLKPIQREKLFSVLDKAVEKLYLRQQAAMVVHTSEGERRIRLEDIRYVERVGRVARYNCTSGAVDSQSLRIPFRELAAPLLRDSRFYMCGASYVLNFQHVTAVNGQQARLDSGEVISLPRTAAHAFKKAWGDYWLECDAR